MTVVRGTFGSSYDSNNDVKLFEAYDELKKVFIGPKSDFGGISIPPIPQDNLIWATPLLFNIVYLQANIADTKSYGFFIDASTNRNSATLIGGDFGDVIRGGLRNDVLKGGAGDDVLEGGAGADRLEGGEGSDTASYAHASATVRVDLVSPASNIGDARGDTYHSIENLIGSAFADRLSGDAGNNVIEGGAGADIIDGRGGFDTVSYAHSNQGVSVDLALTGPQVSAGDASGDVLRNIENIRGSNFDDTIYGTAGDNTLSGAGGADTLIGRGGNDIYLVDRSDELVFEEVGGGTDTVFAARSFTLGDNQEIEALRGRSSADLTLVGNEFAQGVYGSEGNDTIRGAGGADSLIGGEGSDTFLFVSVTDSNRAARDTIRDFVSGFDKIDLSQIVTGAADGHFDLDLSATAFSGQAGELIVTRGATSTQVQGDVDGNGQADLLIVIGGNMALQQGDFILA